MINISAIIVANNNPPYLFDGLKSINDFVSEIIIVDIGLNAEIKNRLLHLNDNLTKIRIIAIKRDIPYVELIREDLKKEAKYDWILFLDPDESIRENLKNVIRENLTKYDYFSIPRKNIIFGKWIEHSRWWPDYQIRLFKKDCVIWPKNIHQPALAKGKELKLPSKENNAIIHNNYLNLDEYLEKAMRYAKSEAQEYINNKRNLSLNETIKKAISEFISRFFAHDGYKDGMHGFVLAILQMFYYFLVYFYWWELKKTEINVSELIHGSNQFFQSGLKETNYWLITKKLTNKLSNIKAKIVNKLLEF